MTAPAVWRFLPVMALGLVVSGCETPGVDSVDPGFVALQAGDFARARDAFLPQHAKYPHDPYIELDLGLAYQGLGQMAEAGALYRDAMIDGRNAVPVTTTNPKDAGRTISEIACEDLKVASNLPDAC
jgi:hypothetical protein